MLKKPLRIRVGSEYKKILNKGRKTYSTSFILFSYNSSELKEVTSKFGFIASKKVGKATVRNRAKRIVREIIRLNLKTIKPGYEIVFILSPSAPLQTYSNLESEILTALDNANLLKNS